MNKEARRWLEIKEISETGTFEGLLSPFGNVDSGGDVVEPGAYTKTLKEGGNTRPLLWQHRDPIGELTLEERKEGLWAKGRLLLDLQQARDAHILIKARVVKGMSIGFKAIKDTVESGVRHLKEIKLYEGSIVTFPMNEAALIASVKAAKNRKADFNAELEQIQVFATEYQMRRALDRALDSILYSAMSREDMISAASSTVEQFSAAYMEFLPQYLDALTALYGGMENFSQAMQERKSGAKFSAETKTKVSSALGKIKGGHDDLFALVSDEAGETTSEGKAATPPDAPEQKPEPETDHSAITKLLTEAKETFQWKH